MELGPEIPFFQVDAFTERAFHGSPAAIFLPPEPLDPRAMQLMAREMNLAFSFFYSMFFGEKAEQNPWKSNTLGWTAAGHPPGHGNFPGGTPHVYRGPYEYSSPESNEDFLPQGVPPEPVRRGAVPREPGFLPTGD